VCLGCPVQVECGRLGIELVAAEWLPEHVIYGGMDAADLRAMARRLGRADRKQARHGTRPMYVKGCRCDPCRRANSVEEAARRRRKRAPRRECPAWNAGGRLCRQPAQPGSIFCAWHAIPADDVAGAAAV
jgi:hypothetical protein